MNDLDSLQNWGQRANCYTPPPKSEETGTSNTWQLRSVYLERKQMAKWGKMVFKDEINGGVLSLVDKGMTPVAQEHAGSQGPRLWPRQSSPKTTQGRRDKKFTFTNDQGKANSTNGVGFRSACHAAWHADTLWRPHYTVTFFLEGGLAAGMKNLKSLNTLLPSNPSSRKLPWKNKHIQVKDSHTEMFASALCWQGNTQVCGMRARSPCQRSMVHVLKWGSIKLYCGGVLNDMIMCLRCNAQGE